MRPRRIYLPLTHGQLRALAADRRLVAPLEGYTAGSPGRVDARISPAAAEEEAEYLAFVAASDHATSLSAGSRRVIASADVAPGSVRESSDPQSAGPVAVLLGEDVPLRAVVSLHVDEEGATAESADPDLLWYDITELATVIDDLGLEH
ncbi:MAG: hypothetical protein WCA30_07040 [Dermatophilaceae bacterium]